MSEVGYCGSECTRINSERCWLKEAEEVAANSKESKDPEQQKKYALKTSNKLKELRDNARIDGCKRPNDIDNNLERTGKMFDYPGRELL